MAVCEHPSTTTSIYTDSESTMNTLTTEPSTDTCFEGSAVGIILDSGGVEKKHDSSSPMGTRRSTRLSKNQKHISGETSDDSDPHIDVGDVLLHEEEKLMKSEVNRKDRREKQMLAVAIVKNAVKQEEESSGQGNQGQNTCANGSQEENACMSSRKRQKVEVQKATNAVTVNSSDVRKPVEAVATRASTRLRTKASRNVGSMAVPNPILSSPALKASQCPVPVTNTAKNVSKAKVKIEPIATNMATRKRTVKRNSSTPARPLQAPISAPLPDNTLATIKEEPMATATLSTQADIQQEPVSLPSRRRIFSIDLDPEGFDFDLSIAVGDYNEPTAALPPITSSSNTVNINPAASRKASDASVTPSDIPMYRGRGLSFELFSFGLSNETSNDLNSEALTGGRPRGDSIIFDPISFSDGGIHEETALRKLRRKSFDMNETDEIQLLNSGGFVEASPAQIQAPQQPIPPQTFSQPAVAKASVTMSTIPNPVSSAPVVTSRSKSTGYRNARGVRVSAAVHSPKSGVKAKHHLTVVGGSQSSKEDTLHMPQGSAAAAAAAASLSSQILQQSMNGTISHTSCPMQLLNKGGRIGIYLPEARRERIAKFHSKRKNRIWRKRIKYDCRKKLADSRPRVKGRFVKSLEE